MLGAGMVLAPVAPGEAQDTLPPHLGGYVQALSLPEIYKPYFGVSIGLWRGEGSEHLASQLRLGVFRDFGNPVTGLVGASLEAYAGVRDVQADAGLRAILASNLLRLGAGADFDVREREVDLLLRVTSPVRRGGIIGGGSDLTIEWLPTRPGSFNLTVNVPLRQPHRGKTRPQRDFVRLDDRRPRPVEFRPSEPSLLEAMHDLRDGALWINRLSVPSIGRAGGDARRAVADAVRPLKLRLATAGSLMPAGRTVHAEIDAYHEALVRAFSIAVSGRAVARGEHTPAGHAVAAHARKIVLERVLFPYNRLLGQWKRKDTTREFGGHARGIFARWLISESPVPPDRMEAAIYVFQYLLDVIEEVRAENRKVWGDDRLVWLPLQLALTPDQYDEQQELDTLLSRAVGRPVTHGNRIWYIHNDRFLLELVASIARADEYHVLWVHDFRGFSEEGSPDRLSLSVVAQAYLTALRDRVERYDSTGRLPVYMIFLDQYYFQVNHSRLLLRFLEDPLGRRLELPSGFESLERALGGSQEELRSAVASSQLLRAETAQYGERWLRNLVKVQVNITNPADPSFRSPQILPLLGIPDDVMRDHRKLVLYDVSEEDPYRGMAMYAGMGVGEVYAGGSWEDRALRLQGPVALGLRDKARELLETQGIPRDRIPHVLRPRQKPPDYEQRIRAEIDSMNAWGGAASRAVELHNGTGFALKEIMVAKATLFNLASPGAVLKTPDSLWLNELLAALLTGAALRGSRVLLIAPSVASAPQPSWGPMALAYDLLARVLAARFELAPEFAQAGGLLRVGIYRPEAGVDDLGYRLAAFHQALERYDFLRDLYPFDPGVSRMLDSVVATSPLARRAGPAAGAESVVALHPKLHFKGFLYVSREAWSGLMSGPMALGFREYLLQRSRQLREGAEVGETAMADAMQLIGALAINPVLDTLPQEEVSRWAFFLQVGSPNHNYRSMVMDGEAAVFVSGWTSLYALPDFVLLTGLVVWIDDQGELDQLLPRPSGLKRTLARWFRMAL
ncbi:MAG: hypothetical protein HYV20_13425 [Gemmatimonadetes bacterium]|nr:hypothetical protein [Gemmatimonadota bacterium]